MSAKTYKKGAPVKSTNSRRERAFGSGDRGQVQNVKAAKVYVFGNDNFVEDSEETVEFEMPEMRARHKGAAEDHGFSMIEETPQQDTYFEKEIKDGETLQAIALKYACPVSELKRLNNLIQDQDFFALRILKVPMKENGILSEQVALGELGFDRRNKSVERSMFDPNSTSDYLSSCHEESDSQQDMSDPETQLKVMRTLSIRENFSRQGREAEKFLKKMDADLKKNLKQVQEPTGSNESLNEVISMLTNKSIHPLPSHRKVSTNDYYCGLTFKKILVTLVTVAVVVPLGIGLMTLYNRHYSDSKS